MEKQPYKMGEGAGEGQGTQEVAEHKNCCFKNLYNILVKTSNLQNSTVGIWLVTAVYRTFL